MLDKIFATFSVLQHHALSNDNDLPHKAYGSIICVHPSMYTTTSIGKTQSITICVTVFEVLFFSNGVRFLFENFGTINTHMIQLCVNERDFISVLELKKKPQAAVT